MKKIWKFLIPSFLGLTTVAIATPILASCSFSTNSTPDNSLVNSGNSRFQFYNSGSSKYITYSVFGLPIGNYFGLQWRFNDQVINSLQFDNGSGDYTRYKNVVKYQGEGNYSVYLVNYSKPTTNTSSTSYYHLSTQYITLADFN